MDFGLKSDSIEMIYHFGLFMEFVDSNKYFQHYPLNVKYSKKLSYVFI